MEFLTSPWPWYVAGPLIGSFVPLMLIIGNKRFGISATLRHVCAMCVPTGSLPYFNYNWKKETWNLLFALGVLIGGGIAGIVFANPHPIELSAATISDLQGLGITNFDSYLPQEIFNWQALWSGQGLIMIVLGGFLVGFGARYANGCTSGHAITGLSMLNLGSLVAVIGFFAGGLLMTYFILPWILQ